MVSEMYNQRRRLLLGAALFVVGAQAQFDYAAVSNPAALQSGDGTYYGADQDNQGTCSYSGNFANTNGLAWTTGVANTLALNDAQFDASAACGLCVMYRGTGAGLGTTPIPATWTRGFVNNRCPECSKGDIDLAVSGDGRWNVEWYAVPCEVGSTPLVYSIVVSSYYWFSLVVSNTNVPITAVSVLLGGSWLDLKRTVNNQWPYYNTNGPWQSSFPMPIRVTNVLGETIEDAITDPAGNTGTKQFGLGGGGASSSAGAAATTPSYPPAYPGSLSEIPTAPPPAVPTPPPVAAPPPLPETPPAPLTPGGFYIENYQQCGGSGGFCNTNAYTAAPCADAAWPVATCRSVGFACTRYDATLWSCIPGANTTYPPPMIWTAPPNAAPPSPGGVTPPPPATAGLSPQGGIQSLGSGSTPPTVAATPPAVSATPPAVAATPPAEVAATPPAVVATPPTPATTPPAVTAAPPTVSSSPPPATQEATPPAAPVTTPPAPTSASGNRFSISDGGQCGGTSQCAPEGTPTDKVTCNNGPWNGAYCSSSSYSCQPDPGPLIWTCKPNSVATGGRRLLGSLSSSSSS